MPLPFDIVDLPEERVVRQLTAAALYENLFRGIDRTIRETRSFEWCIDGRVWRARGRLGAFGRPRLESRAVEWRAANEWRQASIADVVAALPGAEQARAQLGRELEQTAVLMRWNLQHLPRRDRRHLTFCALDAAIDEGHPYHPCFKSRTGFDEADHRTYGPEAGNSFQLVWLAVARDLLHLSLPDSEDLFWQREIGVQGWHELRRRSAALGIEGRDFGLMPIHPWQWRDLSEGRLKSLIQSGRVYYLGTAGDPYRASQSVRSLTNARDPRRSGVKLAMNIVNTSARRTIEPHSVGTAPVLSHWLGEVIDSDPLFRGDCRLDILREHAGLIMDRDGPLGGEIAAIWRESVEGKLAEGETAVPFNALMAVEADGRPFIDPWLSRYGVTEWLDRLIRVALLPVWRLLIAHGIATEAHGQNMVLVHRDGWPERLILRDFHDSLEFVPSFLADPAFAPDFETLNPDYRNAQPNRYYWMQRPEDLRDLFVDCVFVFSLSEISHLVKSFYGIDECAFWQRVARQLSAYITEHDLGARAARLGFGTREILTESLLARKLGLNGPNFQHEVSNTLAGLSLLARESA